MSLKTFFALITIACALIGYRSCVVQSHLAALATANSANAMLWDRSLDYVGPDFVWNGVNGLLSVDPEWPRAVLGDWACLDIFHQAAIVDGNFNDETVQSLGRLSRLQWLALLGDANTKISPAVLAKLSGVKTLILGGEWVTDDHLAAAAQVNTLRSLILADASPDRKHGKKLEWRFPTQKVG
jgi:hypothetical protein